jgi:hypothetical protein
MIADGQDQLARVCERYEIDLVRLLYCHLATCLRSLLASQTGRKNADLGVLKNGPLSISGCHKHTVRFPPQADNWVCAAPDDGGMSAQGNGPGDPGSGIGY